MSCSWGTRAAAALAILVAAQPLRAQPAEPGEELPPPPKDDAPPPKEEAPPEKKTAPTPAPAEPKKGDDIGAAAPGAHAAHGVVDPADAYKIKLGRLPPVWIEGYVSPAFAVKYRPDPPSPRFRLDYGFELGAGFIVRSNPFPMWRGLLNLGFCYLCLRVVNNVAAKDTNGNGVPDTYAYSIDELDALNIEEGTLTFEPFGWASIKAGVMRLPYTIANGSGGTAGLFRYRPSTNEVFLNGTDVGVIALGNFEKRFQVQAGVVNGKSLGLGPDPNLIEVRGPVTTFRTDVTPWGLFGFGEGDPNFGPFRLGLGFGALWRPATYYDTGTGFELTTANDVRLSGSLRLSVAYFGLDVEYLRAQVIDELADRPAVHDGAYASANYYWMLPGFALQPAIRAGFTTLNVLVEPRTSTWFDATLNIFPRSGQPRPDALKFRLGYQTERRITEGETAHAFYMATDLLF